MRILHRKISISSINIKALLRRSMWPNETMIVTNGSAVVWERMRIGVWWVGWDRRWEWGVRCAWPPRPRLHHGTRVEPGAEQEMTTAPTAPPPPTHWHWVVTMSDVSSTTPSSSHTHKQTNPAVTQAQGTSILRCYAPLPCLIAIYWENIEKPRDSMLYVIGQYLISN